jgi:hypothetical protein
MSRRYRAECDGCRARIDGEPRDWRTFTLEDSFGTVWRLDVCPACWPVAKLADMLQAAPTVRPRPGLPPGPGPR